MLYWINKLNWNRCADCGRLRLCKHYWFSGDQEWEKLMCIACFKKVTAEMDKCINLMLQRIEEHDS